MGFKPLELELNSWCNLQYTGFKLQELHDLIFFHATFYKKGGEGEENPREKSQQCCIE